MENARAINLRKERIKRQVLNSWLFAHLSVLPFQAHLKMRRTQSSLTGTAQPVDSDKKQQVQPTSKRKNKSITTKSRVYKKNGKGNKKR